MNRIPLSVLILTRNEEKLLARCLRSVAWADEIVIVDALSTDRTKEIALAAGEPWSGKTRFIERAWKGFREARNTSLDEATHDRVLVIDADEACTPELRDRLTSLLSQPGGPPSAAYKIQRLEFFLGKPIRYGIWNPSYQDRFFDRRGVRYINDVHEYPVFKSPPDLIHEPLEHNPDFGIERFLEKMNTYTSVEALDRYQKGKRTNRFHLFFAFPAMFLKNYFYYGAYKDGIHGFVISVLEGISRAVRHVKIWKIQNERRQAHQTASTGTPARQQTTEPAR